MRPAVSLHICTLCHAPKYTRHECGNLREVIFYIIKQFTGRRRGDNKAPSAAESGAGALSYHVAQLRPRRGPDGNTHAINVWITPQFAR
ncbi:hypothetical protein EVAR_93994_1 [Eumeta japonica]|uniref:Uncharacterized protein n=1 Tax=Eumeta variegata TaxID=151549 RepID=A0A4C1TPB8_EUMVA|nr:hypothetical protein EVAR_93994_1 [Eumeta japonica]